VIGNGYVLIISDSVIVPPYISVYVFYVFHIIPTVPMQH